MEKALIKGEYDSEIAILNIEQRKKAELAEQAKKIEEEIKQLKEKQEARQNDMRERVDIATMKVERLVSTVLFSTKYKFFYCDYVVYKVGLLYTLCVTYCHCNGQFS